MVLTLETIEGLDEIFVLGDVGNVFFKDPVLDEAEHFVAVVVVHGEWENDESERSVVNEKQYS
jgi:hypothetical protein